MSAIITIKHLSKYYRIGAETVKALDNINLEIEKGEICCILGTSGSGKSTLLNQLAGLEKPTTGSVYIGKTNISLLSEDQLAGFRQKNIGFVFQSYNLIASMTAAENVAMPLLFRGVDKRMRERTSADMLKKVGLGNRMRHKPSEMSGGQQQRVGIARAFVARPKIVFADEPTGNLDSKTTLEVMRLLIEMAHTHGITFVLVTHDNELAKYADRIVTLKDGIVISDERNESPAYLESIEDAQKRLEDAENGTLATKTLTQQCECVTSAPDIQVPEETGQHTPIQKDEGESEPSPHRLKQIEDAEQHAPASEAPAQQPTFENEGENNNEISN